MFLRYVILYISPNHLILHFIPFVMIFYYCKDLKQKLPLNFVQQVAVIKP